MKKYFELRNGKIINENTLNTIKEKWAKNVEQGIGLGGIKVNKNLNLAKRYREMSVAEFARCTGIVSRHFFK